MTNCIELIYDRFTVEFFPEGGVQFKTHPMVAAKVLGKEEVTILNDTLYLAVGNFSENTGKKIRANDSAENVTTSAKESKEGEVFEVNVHFEFKNPTKTQTTLCEALDLKPYHIVLNQMDFTGKVASRRIIRNGVGQSRVYVTENQGVISVDATIRNVSGIQILE